jgi:hypothetical protein
MLRISAKIVSTLFHPLLILTYSLILLRLVNPYIFGANSVVVQSWLTLLIFSSTFVLPAFAVFIMSALGLVDSMQLKTKQERIGPYIITGVFYLWMFVNFKSNPLIPAAYTIFVLGATIGLFTAFFVNIFSKISAHTVGMGGFIGMVIITMLLYSYDNFTIESSFLGTFQVSMNTVLMVVILLAGLVGTARLILDAHTNKELYLGFFVGIFSQFIALLYMFK